MSTPAEQPVSRSLVIATVGFYMVAGIVMVTANKWVLVKTAVPIFFLFVQLVIAVICLCFSHLVGVFVIPKFNPTTVNALWKLIAVNVMGLSFNNFTLQYVDASMYQVARGLVLPLTVLLTFVLQSSPPSKMASISCGIVTLGFFIGVGWDRVGGGNAASAVSGLGVFFGVLSSATTACHAIVIKKSLPIVDGSAMDLAWYSNLLSAVVMLPLSVIVGEGPNIVAMWSEPIALSRFIWGGAITGVFGFLICIAGFLSIKVTSPVSHMVSSAMRGVIQTFISVWLFSDIITTGRAASIMTIILGSCHYVWVKSQEQAGPAPYVAVVDLDELEDGRRASGERSHTRTD
ncbi:hypothetical protein BDY24DRAFT_380331 [Mrakia frigida]|uniref:uncharacterized protein n=1 Tax=Mrakia frigida TaxID=29902 RepID=UPI003FCC0758